MTLICTDTSGPSQSWSHANMCKYRRMCGWVSRCIHCPSIKPEPFNHLRDELIAVKDELTGGACLPEGSASPGSMRQVIWASSLRDYESIFNEHVNHRRDY